MSWRSRNLPYDGREIAYPLYAVAILGMGWLFVFQPSSVLGVELATDTLNRFLVYLLTVVGLAGASRFAIREENAHTDFHTTALDLIPEDNCEDVAAKERIAIEILDGIEEDEAERALQTFADAMAAEYRECDR